MKSQERADIRRSRNTIQRVPESRSTVFGDTEKRCMQAIESRIACLIPGDASGKGSDWTGGQAMVSRAVRGWKTIVTAPGEKSEEMLGNELVFL
jgi:hypothetical protein